MTPETAALIRDGLALDEGERIAVAKRLLDSVPNEDDEQTDFGPEWHAAFRRRIDEIESGQVQLVSGAESRARARALLAELKS